MTTKAIKLGDIARDTITGFEGIVVARTRWINNADRYQLQPSRLKDGVPVEQRAFDIHHLEFVSHTEIERKPVDRGGVNVELGDLVEDRITSGRGVAVQRTSWLAGCSRICIQPKTRKENGEPADTFVVDERDCKIIERANPKREPVTTGGPRPEARR